MSLSSSHLDAFAEIARLESFSKAAKKLRLSQPALSQRISKLEDELGVSLLVRDPSGIKITDAGLKLLRYHQTKTSMEAEVLRAIHYASDEEIAGELRIGGYSSVMQSVIMPALAPVITRNSGIRLELFTRETYEMLEMLKRCEVSYVLVDAPIDRQGVSCKLLGHEIYVLTEAALVSPKKEVYLDNDSNDQVTELFFREMGLNSDLNTPMRRSFMGDVHGIIRGVELGFGRAVLPLHLVTNNPNIRIVYPRKKLKIGVYLLFHKQDYETKLHKAVVEALLGNCKTLLQASEKKAD